MTVDATLYHTYNTHLSGSTTTTITAEWHVYDRLLACVLLARLVCNSRYAECRMLLMTLSAHPHLIGSVVLRVLLGAGMFEDGCLQFLMWLHLAVPSIQV